MMRLEVPVTYYTQYLVVFYYTCMNTIFSMEEEIVLNGATITMGFVQLKKEKREITINPFVGAAAEKRRPFFLTSPPNKIPLTTTSKSSSVLLKRSEIGFFSSTHDLAAPHMLLLEIPSTTSSMFRKDHELEIRA